MKECLQKTMLMGWGPTSELTIEKIQRLQDAGRQKGKEREVCVTFGSIRERDLVLSHAPNLQQGNSVDIVIPDSLYPLKRHLEHFAYRVRQDAKIGNKKVFTSVRLCDASSTLKLAVRDDKSKPWGYYTKEERSGLDASLQKLPPNMDTDA